MRKIEKMKWQEMASFRWNMKYGFRHKLWAKTRPNERGDSEKRCRLTKKLLFFTGDRRKKRKRFSAKLTNWLIDAQFLTESDRRSNEPRSVEEKPRISDCSKNIQDG